MKRPAQQPEAATIERHSSGVRVRLEVTLWRWGWIWPLALAAVAAAALIEVLQVRPVRGELEQTAVAILTLQTAVSNGRHRNGAMNEGVDKRSGLVEIEQVLMNVQSTTKQVRLIVDAATRRAIELPRAVYRTSLDRETLVARVQIELPVRASYPKLRAFVEEVLRSLPNASVDHIAFKRETIGQADVEATIRLSLWSLVADGSKPPAIVAITARGGGS